MSRTTQLALTVAAAGLLAVGLASAAYADVAASNCLTTYAGAVETDVLVNGPVHNGGASGGDFTPSIFVNGATAPTAAFLACAV
jgi:hypothetical protein